MVAQWGVGSIAGCKWVAGGLRAQPLALPVFEICDGVGLGLPEIVFQCVLLGRLVEKMGRGLAQRQSDGLKK